MGRTRRIPGALLKRGVERIEVTSSLERRLRSGKKLRIKHGVDPTTKDLHIGHAVAYWKLREFQDLGHTIIFLIGDFTARFGDPTDKAETRAMRSKAEVDRLAEAYLRQVTKILDLKKTEVRRNSEWYDRLTAEELLRLASQFTVSQMLERNMYATRQAEGLPIGLHEPLYPVLQGYDSVMLKSDLTVIGTDQFFNELVARPLQERAGQPPQDIMAMSLLIGTDGKRKMSQSLSNEIGLAEPPQEQFGKAMRIPDGLIGHYFELATLLSEKERTRINRGLQTGDLAPRDAKLRLAREIVTLYHGAAAGRAAEEHFLRIFSRKELPAEMAEHSIRVGSRRLDDLLLELKLASSRSEAQRLIGGGAVRIDGAPMGDWRAKVAPHDGMVVQVGKRIFRRIRRA